MQSMTNKHSCEESKGRTHTHTHTRWILQRAQKLTTHPETHLCTMLVPLNGNHTTGQGEVHCQHKHFGWQIHEIGTKPSRSSHTHSLDHETRTIGRGISKMREKGGGEMGERPTSCVRQVQLTIGEHGPHLQVGRGEADDGRLVQLAGDRRRQGQQLGQLEELGVLLLATRARRILRLFLHHRENGLREVVVWLVGWCGR